MLAFASVMPTVMPALRMCLYISFMRLFLHAHELRFLHPKHETTMHVEAPLDKALNNALKTLRAK